MAVHTSEDIAAFTKGDERMLWAADRVTRRVFYLHDGEAERFRAHTKENLVCVVLDCPAPTITVVARRGNRRQGFRHHTKVDGEGHAMGVFHIQGQNEIRRWLTEKYENSTVDLEVPINGDRDRIADVMMTAGSGERVAFEVQYASLNVAKWEERHADYVVAGIPDVWLFGHAGSQLKLDRDNNVKLNAVHRVVAQNGFHLLWFNPLDQMLATATVTRFFPVSGRTVDVPVYGADEFDAELPPVTLHLFPLADAAVTETGLTAKILHDFNVGLLEALQLEADAIAKRAIALAAAKARREADSAAAAAKKARLEVDEARRVANTAAKLERMRKSYDARNLAWPEHPLRRTILDQFGGSWPEFLDVKPKGEGNYSGSTIFTPFPHQQWEAVLYAKFMHGRSDRSPVTMKDCTAHLLALDSNIPLAKEAVTMWFHRLLVFGVLEKEAFTWSNGSDSVRYVTRDPKARQAELKAEALQQEEQKQGQEQRRQKQLAVLDASRNERTQSVQTRASQIRVDYETWSNSVLSVAGLAAAGTPVKDLPPAIAGQTRCYNCLSPLSKQIEISHGYHQRCAAGIYRSVGLPVPTKPEYYSD